MKQQFEITMEDGTTTSVRVTMADSVAYERTARNRGWGGITDPTSQVTATCFLIWHALNRTGQFTGTFEEFLEQDIDMPTPTSEDDGLDPMKGRDA